jgi:hypothetical protein
MTSVIFAAISQKFICLENFSVFGFLKPYPDTVRMGVKAFGLGKANNIISIFGESFFVIFNNAD